MATASKSFAERVKEAQSKAEMTEWVQKVYAETERQIEPLPPFVLIRTLPRSTITQGGIYLPQKQNKPNIEAIVMAVYEPYWESVDKISEDGKHYDISVYNKCDIEVGDHVILPHFVGLPDSFLDEKEYRFIKEDDAIAVLHYRKKGELRQMVLDVARETIIKPRSLGPSTQMADSMLGGIVDSILENFDVIPKQASCKTLSGA